MHRAAMLGMRMANQNSVARLLILGFFEEGFQFSGGPIDKKAFDAARHQLER
jgi:hypothetical protein